MPFGYLYFFSENLFFSPISDVFDYFLPIELYQCLIYKVHEGKM